MLRTNIGALRPYSRALPGTPGHSWAERQSRGCCAAAAIEAQQLALIGSIVPEDAQVVREQTVAALIAGQATLTSIVRRRDALGAIQHVRLFQKFFRDADGKPVRALGTTSDVTADVAAADQLSCVNVILVRATDQAVTAVPRSDAFG